MVGNTVKRAIASVLAISFLASCAGSPLGETVEQSLEADPQLEASPPFNADPEAAADNTTAATDPVVKRTDPPASTASTTVAIAPEPGQPDFIGPVRPADETARANATGDRPQPQAPSASLEGVPADLHPYIQDLQRLGVIALADAEKTDADTAPSPFTAVISRGRYAQWLFETYNTLYADEPGKRLRPGNPADAPAFQDVPPDSEYFAAIQGLAEAGIIPSALTGNSTAVNFRPDAPLTREALVLWKVPLDIQATLPQTSPDAIAETWGFQDVTKVDPLALRAIAADFQLGDFSNIRRAFGYTTLFQPGKAVTRAEAAAVLWRFGTQTEGRSVEERLEEPDPAAQE